MTTLRTAAASLAAFLAIGGAHAAPFHVSRATVVAALGGLEQRASAPTALEVLPIIAAAPMARLGSRTLAIIARSTGLVAAKGERRLDVHSRDA